MDFDLNDDQRLLRDSVDRLIADRYGFDQRRAFLAEPDGFSRAMWAQFAELGLLGIPFSEAHGGFGGGLTETMIVMEAFGRGLVAEPYLATVVLGAGLLRHAGSPAQQDALLPRVAAGELLLAFAHVERQSRYVLHDVATRATPDGAGWRIEGAKGVVLHGDSADKLLVTARVSGGPRDRDGVGLFLVAMPTPPASPAAATRRRTACAPPRSASPTCPPRPWASPAPSCRTSSAWWTRPSPPCAPRRWA